MFTKLRERSRSDRADSSIVTFIIIFPLFFAFLVTIIDTSIWFGNRALVQQAARDGARTVAIYGGDGGVNGRVDEVSPLERSYGEPKWSGCTGANAGVTANQSSVECNILRRMLEGGGLTNVGVTRIDCGPHYTPNVGSTTYCQIDWTYKGIPGAVMNFIKLDNGESPFATNTTRVASESEVAMTGTPFCSRGAATC